MHKHEIYGNIFWTRSPGCFVLFWLQQDGGRLLSLIYVGEVQISLVPLERGIAMYVTFGDLMQYSLVVIGIITVVISVHKKK